MGKIFFKNSRGLTLAGGFLRAESNAVVILAHGFTGDKSERGRFDQASAALVAAGYNTLAFDFGGSGESDDAPLTVGGQVYDLNAAVEFVLRRGLTHIGVLGLSLGGLVATRAYSKRIAALVFWAPVTAPLADPRARYTAEQLRELDETGRITYRRDNGIRRVIIIGKQMLEDRRTVDQRAVLSGIRCPVLIVHGSNDDRVPPEDSRSALRYLPPGSELKVIEGANHHFYEQLSQFIGPTVEWFSEHLEK